MRAKLNHHNLLFGLDPPLPVETPATPADLAARRDAQTAFAKYIKENGNLSPLLLARFTARSVDEETYKMLPPQLAPPRLPSDLPEPVGAGDIEYTHADHIERLRFLEVTPGLAGEEEIKHLRDILRTAMNGLEEFVDEHRFFVHKGKVLYNAIGVVIEDDRVNTVNLL